MARRSPQTERLVEIIDYLASTPQQPRNLTDIARQLGVDKTTCIPMLTELTSVGWLVKSPDNKEYQLGPRLVALGHAAAEASHGVLVAAPYMTELADELGCACALIIRSSDGLVVAATAQPGGSRLGTLGMRSGDRLHFRPPLGGVFVAWANHYTAERWIARSPGALAPEECAHYRRGLAKIRARGYGVEQFKPEPRSMTDLVEDRTSSSYGSRRTDLIVHGLWDELAVEWLMDDIMDDETYYPVSINAAVFDSNFNAQSAVCALDTGRASGVEVCRIGHRVADVARTITQSITGRIGNT